ncbi:MAG: helix-turn-helix domain-containing protein [Bacteriovoracaceae bacterium]|nr:helix-turn-helix domain-containing protein [Bacteriovoracaceae bacterium]
MKCIECGSKTKRSNVVHHYVDCGLNNIYIAGTCKYKCTNQSCGEDEIAIPNIFDLHELIAQTIATQKHKLLPQEIRFLRTHLGFSGVDFSKRIGVAAETISRWEKGTQKMSLTHEKLLRIMVLAKLGPIRNYDDMIEFGAIEKKRLKNMTFVSQRNKWRFNAAA